MALNYEGDNPRSGLFDHRNKGVSPTVFDENSISLKISDESRVGEISTQPELPLELESHARGYPHFTLQTPLFGPRKGPRRNDS